MYVAMFVRAKNEPKNKTESCTRNISTNFTLYSFSQMNINVIQRL